MFRNTINCMIVITRLLVKTPANGSNKPQHCCVLLASKVASVCVYGPTVSNYTKQVPKSANIVVVPCKRTQHAGPNNVASVCMGLYKPGKEQNVPSITFQ